MVCLTHNFVRFIKFFVCLFPRKERKILREDT
uniref:Uncharacterized protein n=1 Tax=Marseillevirus sp. TaxID=2809551 RepID=A0AA96EP83_9VIRU|nr:hypothetical protein MarFTMF_212 [Marseillevirus sp.]